MTRVWGKWIIVMKSYAKQTKLEPHMRKSFNLLKQKFYVLPSQCIYVFCVDLRTNSDYFLIQH